MVIKETQYITVLTGYTCDKCGERIVKDDDCYNDAFFCRFQYKEGDSFPEGFCGEDYRIDLCQKCGKELFDELKAKGFHHYDNEEH